MQITIIASVFPPEPVISAQTSYQLARALHKIGHRVSVITNFPNRPSGKLFPGYRRRLYSADASFEGIKVMRCWNILSQKSSIYSRLLENLSFGITSSLLLLFSRRPDLIYANTWPVFAQGMICLVARLRRIPVVLSIQDIYPESLAVQGRFSSMSVIYRVLRWLDRANAHLARALIVISTRFAQIYSEDRGIPVEKIHIIPNWIDLAEIELLPRTQFRKKAGIPENAFVFCYAGNIGVASGIEQVIEAFEKFQDSNTYLVIAGDGSHKMACEELIRKRRIKNIILHSPWLKGETSEVLSSADVFILPTYGEQSLASVPSKMLNYMLAARPILAVVVPNSDIAQMIKEANCGWQVDPMDQDLLVSAMRIIQNTKAEQINQLGIAGYEYVVANYSKEKCLSLVIEVFTMVVDHA